MELYYTIYFFLLLSLFFEFTNQKVKNRVMLLWCVFFVIFGGIRWETGNDWEQYYNHFLYSKWSNIFNYDRYGNGAETLEPGFLFVNVLVKTIFGEFYVYNLLVCALIEYSYYKFCRYFSPKHPLIPFILMNMGPLFPVRAGLSIGVAYLAYKPIKERNLKQFLLILTLATLIHNQCIVLLPIYWIGKIHINDKILLVLYAIFAFSTYLLQEYFTLAMILLGGSIAEKAYAYTEFETIGAKGASYIGWALNFFFLCIYLYVAKATNTRNTLWGNTMLNGFLIYMLVFFSFQEGMGDLARLSSMYFPIQLILFSQAYSYFVDKRKGILALCAILFVFAYYTYKWTGICDGYFFEDANIPYKTIFE